jgi:hypothetical protein
VKKTPPQLSEVNMTVAEKPEISRRHEKSTASFEYYCKAMQERRHVVVACDGRKPVQGIIVAIEAEDGSGKSWLLTLATPDHRREIVYIRTK